MRHRHRVREIAEQAGLSQATVDRVLHGRPGVRAGTVAEVERAVADLDRQHTQLRLAGRTFLVDLVMQAPDRFSSAVRRALEAELPGLRPGVFRSRFHLGEEGDPARVAEALDRIGRRGSDGVLLKAPDHPVVVEALDALTERGIPVVTAFTDVPTSRRLAYVGIDNRAAGATAAYLLGRWSRDQGSVLVSVSSLSYQGEEERRTGFRTALAQVSPGRAVREVAETQGLDAAMLAAVAATLATDATISSVYSIGGGNTAILQAFADAGRPDPVVLAHDLDADNTRLLRQHRIAAVLHHDLGQDLRRACRLIMQAHGALPGRAATVPSQIQVVTPFNEPSGFADPIGPS